MAQDYSPEIVAAIEAAYAKLRNRIPSPGGTADPTIPLAEQVSPKEGTYVTGDMAMSDMMNQRLGDLISASRIGAALSAQENEDIAPGQPRYTDPLDASRYPGV